MVLNCWNRVVHRYLTFSTKIAGQKVGTVYIEYEHTLTYRECNDTDCYSGAWKGLNVKVQWIRSIVNVSINRALETDHWSNINKSKSRHAGHVCFFRGMKSVRVDFGVPRTNGGVCKMAKSPEALNSKKTRMGTYDKNLVRIGD